MRPQGEHAAAAPLPPGGCQELEPRSPRRSPAAMERRKSDVNVTFKRKRLSDLGKVSFACKPSSAHPSIVCPSTMLSSLPAGRLRAQRHAARVGGAHAAGRDCAAAAATAAAGWLLCTAPHRASGLGPAARSLLLRVPGLGAAAGDDQPADDASRLPCRLPWRPCRRITAAVGPLHGTPARRCRPSSSDHAAAGGHSAHALQRGDPTALAACGGGLGSAFVCPSAAGALRHRVGLASLGWQAVARLG